jgi:hypothetical protein
MPLGTPSIPAPPRAGSGSPKGREREPQGPGAGPPRAGSGSPKGQGAENADDPTGRLKVGSPWADVPVGWSHNSDASGCGAG